MKKGILSQLTILTLIYTFFQLFSNSLYSQNINSSDGVNWVGQANSYHQPNNGSGAANVLVYRKVSTTASNPIDGRGQWKCTLNAQSSGGDVTNINMTGGGSNGFLFTSGGGFGNTGMYSNKWNFAGIGAAALNAINGVQWTTGGGNDMGLNMSTTGRYTFVLKDAGYTATGFYVGYTSADPVTLTHNISTQLVTNTDRSATVIATTTATPSSGENVYVRYNTSNDFSGGSATSIVQASGSTTTWTATIPSQSLGSTIYYYVFTSTMSLSNLNGLPEADKSYALLNYADNSGSNYQYTLTSAFSSTTSGNWSSASTWAQGHVPYDDASVTIANNVTLDQNARISSLTINSSTTFTASDASPRTLTINSNSSATTLTNNGTFAFGTGLSTVSFLGAPSGSDALQTITGNAIAFENVTIGKSSGSVNEGVIFGNSTLTGILQINDGGFISSALSTFYTSTSSLVFNHPGYTIQPTDATWPSTNPPPAITVASGLVTMNASRSLFGSLTVSTGATLNLAGQSFTLKSTSSGTARIAPIAGTISNATNVTVERYIPAYTNRAWRLLSIPTTTSNSINAAWQNSQTTGGTGTLGLGAWITSNIVASYFDAQTASGSMLYYDQTSGTQGGYVSVPNTTMSINTDKGYMLYVRGDRTATNLNSTTSPTTLQTTGALKMGTYPTTPIAVGVNKFEIIGNPYPSEIDMRNVTFDANLDHTFYLWDPKLTGVNFYGGYQTFTYTGSDFLITPGGGSYGSSGTAYNFVQSGQAFFVHGSSGGTGATNAISFTEASKSTGTSNIGYNPTTVGEQLVTNLYAINGGVNNLADGTLSLYSNAYSNNVDANDAIKLANFGINLGILRSGTTLAVEKRQIIGTNDTIFFKLTGAQQQQYQFQIIATNLNHPGLYGFLQDSYLNSLTPLNLNGSTSVTFTVDGNAGSSASNRFRILFSPLAALPITFLNARAYQVNQQIAVEWSVANENNIRQYEVEKSTNGTTFNGLAIVNARNNSSASSYSQNDLTPVTGYNFYRIKSVGLDGTVKYSVVLKVLVGSDKHGINIYPNPIVDGIINLQLNNMPAGMYDVKLINTIGQVLYSQQVNHSAGSSTEALRVTSLLQKGIYQLEIVTPDNTKIVKQLNY